MKHKNHLRIAFLFLIALVLNRPLFAAEDPYVEKMAHAYSLIQQKDYLNAITEFNGVYWASKVHSNDALFFIIYCQNQLKYTLAAKTNIGYLNIQSLSPSKQEIIKKIQLLPTPP